MTWTRATTCVCAAACLTAGAAGQAVLSGRTVPYAIRDRQPLYLEAVIGMSEGCSITAVTVDCTAIGLGQVALADDGVQDDGVAGNDVWGRTVAIPPGVIAGAKILPIHAHDECGGVSDEGPALAVYTLAQCDWSEQHDARADAGELPATAQPVGRLGSLGSVSTIWGHLSQPTGRDVDMYRVRACDPSQPSRFIVQFAGTDIQLFLFDAAGYGVAHHDGLTTDLTAARIDVQLGPGEYLIAVSTADRDPLSAGNLPIWLDEPRDLQHPPDGPGAAHPIIGWGGAPIPVTADYNIIVHNICQTTPACDPIDFNADGIFPDAQDIADLLAVFSGGVCAGQQPADPPCNADTDFNNDGLVPDTLDIQSLLTVFSGGPCI